MLLRSRVLLISTTSLVAGLSAAMLDLPLEVAFPMPNDGIHNSIDTTMGNVEVGILDWGVLTLDGGADTLVTPGAVNIGVTQGGEGLVLVRGGADWDIPGSQLLIANQGGAGRLSITGGSSVSAAFISVGESSFSPGAAEVSGSDGFVQSSLSSTSALVVGNNNPQALGTLHVSGGGFVTAPVIQIANREGSTGSVTVIGTDFTTGAPSTMTTTALQSGVGQASLNIANGGQVSADDIALGGMAIQVYASDGNGTRSMLQTPNKINLGGPVSLQVRDGGQVSAGEWSLGDQTLGDGVVNVSITGSNPDGVSTLTSSGRFMVGTGPGSSATLKVANGGVATLGDRLEVPGGSGGTAVVSVVGPGSSVTVASDLFVGNQGVGTLNVAEGAVLTHNGRRAAFGGSGSAIVRVTDGATLNLGPDVNVGSSLTGVGTVVVEGLGSTMSLEGSGIASDPADRASSLGVGGRPGTGVLEVRDGGMVSLIRNTTRAGLNRLRIGWGSPSNPPAKGHVGVRGPGSLISLVGANSLLDVGFGNGSFGTLHITEGGQVVLPIDAIAFAGRVPGNDTTSPPRMPAEGHVLVSGPNADCDPLLDECSLLDTGALFACGKTFDFTVPDANLPPFALGDGGKGTVNVRNGGIVRAAEIVIGPDCVVFGDGTLDGNVTLEGTMIPGNSPGTITIGQSLTVTETATIKIEVAGSGEGEFDSVEVPNGTVTLAEGSTIQIQFAESVELEEAATLPLVQAESIEGSVEIELSVEGSSDPPVVIEFEATGSSEVGVTVTPEGNVTVSNEVPIDVKPGSDDNTINLGASGVIPVAILSSGRFDATTVDPASVSFGGAMVRTVGKAKLLCHQEDSNLDGLVDLICQVETSELLLDPTADVAVLSAQTFSGAEISGRDAVLIVP